MQVTAAMVKELREMTGAGMSACKNALVEANGDMKRANEILREKGLAAAAKKAGRIAAEGLVATAIAADRKFGAMVEVSSETDFVAKNEDFVAFVKQVAQQVLDSKADTAEAILAEKWQPDPSQTVGDIFTQKVATIGENIGLRRFARYQVDGNGAVVDYIHGGGKMGVMLTINSANITDEVLEAGRNVCMQITAMSPQYVSRDNVPEDYIKSETAFLTKTAMKENEESDKPKPANIIEGMIKGRLAKQLKEICLLDQEYVKEDGITVEAYLKKVGADVKIEAFTRFEKGEGVEKKEVDFAAEVAAAMNG